MKKKKAELNSEVFKLMKPYNFESNFVLEKRVIFSNSKVWGTRCNKPRKFINFSDVSQQCKMQRLGFTTIATWLLTKHRNGKLTAENVTVSTTRG